MRILALETSGRAGSVAALQDDQVLVERELESGRRTAQTLTPTMQEVLQQVGWQPADVTLLAVTRGPGSFTGLRIGVTAAKTFAFATGAALVGVNTLAVIARNAPPPAESADDQLLWVVLNAERDQLYAASFRPETLSGTESGRWGTAEPTRILDNAQWLNRLQPGMSVLGPGLTRLADRIPDGVRVLPEGTWEPRAAEVAREGLAALRRGEQSDWTTLLPDYFRESAAVEKAQGSGP